MGARNKIASSVRVAIFLFDFICLFSYVCLYLFVSNLFFQSHDRVENVIYPLVCFYFISILFFSSTCFFYFYRWNSRNSGVEQREQSKYVKKSNNKNRTRLE